MKLSEAQRAQRRAAIKARWAKDSEREAARNRLQAVHRAARAAPKSVSDTAQVKALQARIQELEASVSDTVDRLEAWKIALDNEGLEMVEEDGDPPIVTAYAREFFAAWVATEFAAFDEAYGPRRDTEVRLKAWREALALYALEMVESEEGADIISSNRESLSRIKDARPK